MVEEKRMSALEVAAVRLAVALRKDPNANYDAVSARIAFAAGFEPIVLRTYVAGHRRAFVHSTPKRGD